MFAKRIATAALAAMTLLPGLAQATPTGMGMHGTGMQGHCILKQHRVTKVEALKVIERYGRGTSERLVGARVFVQAEPGLTAEWLQLTIGRHITEMSGTAMANCPLKDVQVTVTSAGTGFAVQIAGKSSEQAKEILRRAQLLVQ